MSGVKESSVGRLLMALLLGLVLFRIGAAFVTAGQTELTVWGDRDLWRGLSVAMARTFADWPLTGPEINGGLRPPGGAFYLLLGAILSIQPSALAAHLGLLGLFAASVLLLGLAIGSDRSWRAGVIAAAALAGAPMLDEVLKIWNPGFLLFFATALTVFGLRYLKNGGAVALGLASAALAIGLQIHLQIVQLAVALSVAAAFRRPGWSRSHLLAVLIGWGLPWLPTLAAGGAHLFTAAAMLPGDAVENYVLWEFHPLEKAELIYGMLGGTPQIVGGLAAGAFSGPGMLPMLGDLSAALLVLAFLGGLGSERTPRKSVATPYGSLSLVLAVYLAVALASSVNARHVVAAWPAVAAITGLSADALLRRLEERGGIARMGGICLLLCAFAARPFALGAATLHGAQPFAPGSLAAQAEIAATTKALFYADREAFDSHASLFWRQAGRPWQLVQEGVAGQMDFVYRTTPARQTAADHGSECLAIVPREQATATTPADLARSPAFSGRTATIRPEVQTSEHFAYLPYTTADGNCLKSFPNAYIPTRFEAAYLAPDGAPAAFSAAGQAIFTATLPGSRFPIGVEVRPENGRYVATLHGRLLRGYTGLHFATIINPTLCLTDDRGVRVQPIARTTVGSPLHGTLTPWRSATFDLPDGDYRVWLLGRDGKSPHFLRIPLGQLSLPGMRADAPPPEMADLPAGCPVPSPSGGPTG